eukprot:symbB.v1.2.001926.t1/scaffold55.1/size374282/8
MNLAAVLANVILCNSLVSACEESGQWENALEVFKKLSCFTSSSVISINAGIAAGGRGSLWQFSAHLLHQLVQETGCRPTIVSFNAALSACAGCKKWRAVLGITEDFSRCGLEPDAISLNSVAGALERQGRWVGASKLLFEAQKCGERLLGPEVTTIGVAVDSSQRFGSVARAAGLLGDIQRDAPQNLRHTARIDLTKSYQIATIRKPLPDKNELANACYFTYKVGYVICDTTLGPEAAQREMEAGRCNQDFRLTGSDFQRLVLKHYLEGGRPPLEEATWLLTSSDNFQSRTLSECPPMQILANMLYAEALLYLDGASRYGESAELVAQALQQTKRVQTEVLNALSHTWPLDIATHRFQETFLTVDGVAKQATLATSPSEKESVHLALCRCSENLDWFVSLLNKIGSQPHLDLVIHLYETCGADEGTQELQELQAAVFGHVKRHDVPVVELGGTSASSDCTTHLVLKHLLGHGNDVKTLPKFLLFLPSAAPLEAEEQLYKVVFKSITSRTLDVDFMALGLTRSPPISLNACQKDLIQSQVLNIQNYPLGYEGPRFLVSSQRLRDSMNQVRSLISTFEQPPPHCTLEQLEIAVANWWHIVFGEAAQLPIRADDDRLPMFVRVSDGPSGFSRTRMPKSSDYLSWAAIGLHN